MYPWVIIYSALESLELPLKSFLGRTVRHISYLKEQGLKYRLVLVLFLHAFLYWGTPVKKYIGFQQKLPLLDCSQSILA